VVPITHEQTIICSKTRLDGTTHEKTIICRQLFAGHVAGCRPMEGKKKLHGIMIKFIFSVERLSPSEFKLFVAFFIINSVTDRPTSSCFVAGFQVISAAGGFAASYFSLHRY